MEYSINLDIQQIISIEALKHLPYLSNIYFTLTIDCDLQQKLLKINQLVEFLSDNPTIKTKLKVLSIKKNPLKEYKVVTVGGTFDRMHIGHQILLLYAALSASETIHIGITADWLLTHKKYNQVIQKMVVRMNNVIEFVKTLNPTLQIIAYQLKDLVGTNTTQKTIQCVIFSPQPGDNLIEINTQRVKNGLRELEVVRCPILSPIQHQDEKFSSTYIRKQLLDKNKMSLDELEQYRKYFGDLIQKLTKIKSDNKVNIKLAQIWWDQIYFDYSQRWRFYHTNCHIYQLFKLWNSSCFHEQRESLSLEEKTVLSLALFFHNIVYRPGDANNTIQSAKICQSFIRQYLGNSSSQQLIINEAKRLILQTVNHKQPLRLLQQIFFDLEMRVFNNSTQDKFYAKSIMKEYQQQYCKTFPQQRIEELAKMLKKGMHFSFKTEHVKSNLE